MLAALGCGSTDLFATERRDPNAGSSAAGQAGTGAQGGSAGQGGQAYAACALTERAPAADASAPRVFWLSQPVAPNESVLLSTTELDEETSLELALVPNCATASGPLSAQELALDWQSLTPQLKGERSLHFVVPENYSLDVYALRLVAGATSRTYFVNRPEPWFVQGDLGQSASPGGWIGVFGTAMSLDESPAALALTSGGELVATLEPHPSRPGTRFGQYFLVPSSIAPGSYELYVHNGHGGLDGWVKFESTSGNRDGVTTLAAIEIGPRAAWPSTVIDVSAQPGVDDDERFAAALLAAADGGGGIVYVPAGNYSLTEQLQVPDHTLVRGDGADLTKLTWTGDPAGGAALIRASAVTDKSNGDTRGSFSMEDLTLEASATFASYAVELSDATEPSWFRRLHVVLPNATDEETAAFAQKRVKNVEISNCQVEAYRDITGSGASSHLLIENNLVTMRGATELDSVIGVLYSQNHVVRLPNDPSAIEMPGMRFGPFSTAVVRDVYFANNVSEQGLGESYDDSWTLRTDNPLGHYLGHVASVEGVHMVLAAPPTGGEAGIVAQIVAGTGAGQWRTVVSLDAMAGELDVDRPWEVEPDATSFLNLYRYMGRMLIVDNDLGVDNVWSYGTSHDFVVADNRLGHFVRSQDDFDVQWIRQGGAANIDDGGYRTLATGWGLQWLANEITRAGVDLRSTTNEVDDLPAEFSGAVVGAHVFRNNVAQGLYDTDPRFALQIAGRTSGLLIENNAGLTSFDLQSTAPHATLVRCNTLADGSPVALEPAPGIVVMGCADPLR